MERTFVPEPDREAAELFVDLRFVFVVVFGISVPFSGGYYIKKIDDNK